MTPEQAAAFVNGQTAMMLAEIETMKAEDRRPADRAEPHSRAKAWAALSARWEHILGYNAITSLFQQTNY